MNRQNTLTLVECTPEHCTNACRSWHADNTSLPSNDIITCYCLVNDIIMNYCPVMILYITIQWRHHHMISNDNILSQAFHWVKTNSLSKHTATSQCLSSLLLSIPLPITSTQPIMHESHHSTKSAHPCFQALWAVVSLHPDHCSFRNYWTAIVQVPWKRDSIPNIQIGGQSVLPSPNYTQDCTHHLKYSHGSNHTHSLTSIQSECSGNANSL